MSVLTKEQIEQVVTYRTFGYTMVADIAASHEELRAERDALQAKLLAKLESLKLVLTYHRVRRDYLRAKRNSLGLPGNPADDDVYEIMINDFSKAVGE